jgi:hypothetical protein
VTIVGFVNNSYLMSRMSESNPPDFSQGTFLVLLGLLVISILLLALHPKRLDAGRAFLLVGFSAMSLMAARNIHLYGVVAPFVLAETLVGLTRSGIVQIVEKVLKSVEGKVRFVLWPIVTSLVFVALILTTKVRNIYAFDPTFFPIDAVTWLEAHPQEGRMFNDLNWGGYLAWRLWPDQNVFADSMADVTGEMTLDYETILTMSTGWEDLMRRYNITWVILPPDIEIVQTLRDKHDWLILYTDSTAVILRKK